MKSNYKGIIKLHGMASFFQGLERIFRIICFWFWSRKAEREIEIRILLLLLCTLVELRRMTEKDVLFEKVKANGNGGGSG